MEADVLNLLPPRGLDQSILLAVLMGLLVLLFLTECFGWVFAGLVVPGYLASVFVMSPGAGVAIVFEAIITFLISRTLTDFVSRSEAGTQFFGRERFFVIVLVSVIVRQNSEIWLLPSIAPYLDSWFGTMFAPQRQLSSIGLVLVPLTANMFWKHDIRRGLMQVGMPVAITFSLLYFLVLPYTNLSYSSLELTYENTALDFLASPKAYIILLVGAYLASRFNLTYGWDYNGILVPALLSLTWMEPMRVMTTVIEAIILLYAAKGFMRLPTIRTFNFEGPRKVVLVFVIGFILKYGLSWAIGDHAPTQRVTDLFGFGYLLPSLLATKMLQKKTVGRVLLPALETSLLAFILANLLGIGLDALAPPSQPDIRMRTKADASPTSVLLRDTMGATMLGQVRTRLDSARIEPLERPRVQLRYYEALWRDMDEALPESSPSEFRSLFSVRAHALGLVMRRVSSKTGREAFVLMESEESLIKQYGWETALLFPGSKGPVITIPRPQSENYAAPGALWICERIHCRALILSGVDTGPAGVREGDALDNARTSFNFAHRALERTSVLQVSVYEDSTGTDGSQQPTLLVKGRLASDINFDKLWPAPIVVEWDAPPGSNVQWSERENLAVLRIPEPAMVNELLQSSRPTCTWPETDLAAFLTRHLDAPRGPDGVRAPVSAPCGWLAVVGEESSCSGKPAATGAAALLASGKRAPLTRHLIDLSRRIPRRWEQLRQTRRATTRSDDAESVCSAADLPGPMEREDASEARWTPLSDTEALFMQNQLLIPLIHGVSTLRDDVPALGARIRWLREMARLVGYELGEMADCDGTGSRCWVLAQHRDSPARSSIMVVVRAGESKRLAIEVPRPDTEPGTWRLGFELWRRTQARVLLLGLPVYETRAPSVAHDLREKRDRIFQALHRGLDTALSTDEKRALILQVRGYGSWRQLDDGLVIGVGRPLLDWHDLARNADEEVHPHDRSGSHEYTDIDWQKLQLPRELEQLLSEDEDGLLLEFGPVRPADGAEEIIELRGPRNPQLAYSRRIDRTDMAVLWFSQNVRFRYRSSGSTSQCRELQRRGLLDRDDAVRSVASFLTEPGLAAPPAKPSKPLNQRVALLRRTMERGAAFENVHLLRKLVQEDQGDDNLRVRAFADASLGRPYLALELRGGDEIYRIAALLGDEHGEPATFDAGANLNATLSRALLRRATPIVIHGTVAPPPPVGTPTATQELPSQKTEGKP